MSLLFNFGKAHLEREELIWERALWNDCTKIELFGFNHIRTILLKKVDPVLPEALATVQLSGGSIMF